MIASLRGLVSSTTPTSIVIVVGGLGMRAEVTGDCAARARIGDELELQTQLVVREDALTLYGFTTEHERELFNLLTTVSGVGPKLALSILSALSPERLAQAIRENDEKALTGVSGVGAKTAKLILVSLQEKVASFGLTSKLDSGNDVASDIEHTTVVQALISLGWSETAAQEALRAAIHAGADTDESSLLKASLLLLQQSPVRN